MAERRSTVAVDFDGVIHAYSKGWGDGTIYDEPVPGALDGLHSLMANYAVYIHTSRGAKSVAEWLQARGFETTIDCEAYTYSFDADGWKGEFWDQEGILLVTNRKLAAVAYIDDRAIEFRNWNQALGELLMRQAGAQTRKPGEKAGVAASIAEAGSLDEAVHYALGAASVAWTQSPQGIFESHYCHMVAEALIERINREVEFGPLGR